MYYTVFPLFILQLFFTCFLFQTCWQFSLLICFFIHLFIHMLWHWEMVTNGGVSRLNEWLSFVGQSFCSVTFALIKDNFNFDREKWIYFGGRYLVSVEGNLIKVLGKLKSYHKVDVSWKRIFKCNLWWLTVHC